MQCNTHKIEKRKCTIAQIAIGPPHPKETKNQEGEKEKDEEIVQKEKEDCDSFIHTTNHTMCVFCSL